MNIEFNRNPIIRGRKTEIPTQNEIKSTPSLWNASLDDAIKYGGDLTKMAIGAMDLKGDRKYIIVDTKVHMLMPGFYPAIPNWHTDGVPRGNALKPEIKEYPNIFAQENMTAPRFYLYVTGNSCLTEFIRYPIYLNCELGSENYNLYTDINSQLKNEDFQIFKTIPCEVVEWDWWNLHRAVQATQHEWRFLIRVTETDHIEPQKDLRQIIRTQQQVYVPQNFGW